MRSTEALLEAQNVTGYCDLSCSNGVTHDPLYLVLIFCYAVARSTLTLALNKENKLENTHINKETALTSLRNSGNEITIQYLFSTL